MCASSANMLTFETEDKILALPSSLLNATQLFRTLYMLHHVSHPFVLSVNPGAPFLSPVLTHSRVLGLSPGTTGTGTRVHGCSAPGKFLSAQLPRAPLSSCMCFHVSSACYKGEPELNGICRCRASRSNHPSYFSRAREATVQAFFFIKCVFCKCRKKVFSLIIKISLFCILQYISNISTMKH